MSNLKVNTINDTSGGSNAVLYGVAAPANSMGFRNRIINGDMRIDQRNAGASITPTSGQYSVDRWAGFSTQASKYSLQQNAGSVTPPAGFTNYLGATSLSAYSVGSGDIFTIQQRIEGVNVADLAWGTASAQSVTLSFWVRSSLTGTFGGAVNNNTARSYPFSFTISAANTWEQKTVTIPGDTTGTWATNTSAGIFLCFGLGGGSTYSSTAGSWQAGAYYTATGATSVVGTNGATFYITGVQLEAGSVASPFERVDYGRQLNMCQRYYQVTGRVRCFVIQSGNGVRQVDLFFNPATRAAPTITGTFVEDNGGSISSPTFSDATTMTAIGSAVSSGGSTGSVYLSSAIISSEL